MVSKVLINKPELVKADFHHFSHRLVLMLIWVKVDFMVDGLVIVSNHAYLLKCALTRAISQPQSLVH